MELTYKGHSLFAFSDTHGMYRRVRVPRDTEILICAGDACEGIWPKELEDFFQWYASIPAALRIFVPGNHEIVFDVDPKRARNLVPPGIHLLEDGGLTYGDIRFHSVPARSHLKGPVILPKGIDFLITHGPAYGYLDRGEGDRWLYLAIANARPRYHIFGHVHEEGEKRKAFPGGTCYLNVSCFEELRCRP